MKRLIPFSNGTEAQMWLEKNCEICKTKCHNKRNIEDGFILGNITIKTAQFIGYTKMDDKFVSLLWNCKNKNIHKKGFRIDKTPTLF